MLDKNERLAAGAAWLRSNEGAMKAALARLVAENSFTTNLEGGNRVGRLLLDLFEREDLPCEVRKSTAFADHLVFRTAAAGQPIALVGHLDTVFPPGTFEGYREDGLLGRGPGVLDMKGGLLVTGFALLALAHVRALAELALTWVVVSDEEVGSPEGQAILRDSVGGATCGLVFEAGRTGDAIVTRRKGTGSLVATARGRAAHAGNLHHEGVNAIWALSRFIDRAQALTDYARGATVNVGTVEGGDARNTVPDRARAELDIRFGTTGDGELLASRLAAEAASSAATVPGASIELAGGITRRPLERSPASENLYLEYAGCARASGLGASEAPLAGGGSDANTLAALGIPCIDGLGPRGAGYHTHDERIEIATLVPKAEALLRFLLGRIAPKSS
jgi:glutamate carboxypeptidase